jgi:hypothetical protein
MRRLLLLLAVIAGLAIAATPVVAATTFHTRETGAGLNAYFTNEVWDEEGNLPDGPYFSTSVYAAERVATGEFGYEDATVCVERNEYTIDDGNWTDESWFGACGPYDSLTIARKLASGNVTASFDAVECQEWDKTTGMCITEVNLGTVEIDVTATASGPQVNYHGTNSGGTAGQYQSTYHGNGSSRDASVTGTVTLKGASLIAGAKQAGGEIFKTKSGDVDVMHG